MGVPEFSHHFGGADGRFGQAPVVISNVGGKTSSAGIIVAP